MVGDAINHNRIEYIFAGYPERLGLSLSCPLLSGYGIITIKIYEDQALSENDEKDISISVASGVPSVYTQGEADAIRYSRTELGGSARFRSMAGAFGALGGDFSAIGQNPAGLGIFRSSEVSATIDFSSISNRAAWQGSSETFNKNKLLFTGIGYVGSWGKANEDVSVNFGLGAKRVLDYERSFRIAGGEQKFSVAQLRLPAKPIRLISITMDWRAVGLRT